MSQNEKILIEKIINGSKEDYRIIISKYKRLVFHIIFRLVSNVTEREELGQEIFVKIYTSLPSFKFESNLATWITRIAHNTCVNYLRKKKMPLYDDHIKNSISEDDYEDSSGNISEIESDNISHDKTIENKEISDLLDKEIVRLPAMYKEIISLYYLEHYTYKEISKIVLLPEGTIKGYMFRARALLKNRLVSKYQLEEL